MDLNQLDPNTLQPVTQPAQLDENLAGVDEDEQIRSLILANCEESRQYRQSSQIIDDLKEWHDLYMGIPKKKPYAWMSNIFVPMTSSKVDTGVSNVMEMTIKTDQPVDVRPCAFGQGDDHHAKIIKALVNRQLKGEDFFYKFYQYVKALLIYGTAIGKVCWDSRPKRMNVKKNVQQNILSILGLPVGQQMMGSEVSEEYADISDKPVFDVCNIGEIAHDPQSIEITDSWVCHELLRSIDYLQSRAKSEQNPYGIYNNNVMQLKPSDASEYRQGRVDVENSSGKATPQVTRPSSASNIKIKEWVGQFFFEGKFQTCIFTLAADKYVIRKEALPYWITENNNYVKGTYIPLVNEFYGVGIPQLLEDLQNNINETINQRNDNISFVLNPMLIYMKNSGINLQGLVAKPGGTYGVDEKDAIHWDRPPDVTQSNFAHTQELERWAQEVTAISKITLGTGGTDVNNTATGMAILQKSANDRFLIMAKIVEYTSFNKIAKMFYELDYQFYDQYKIAAILGIDPNEIDMSKMAPHYYDFVPDGIRTMEDKTTKALKLLQAMTIGKDQPDFDMRKSFIKYIELLDISDNPEKELMRSPEQAMALRQAELVKQQMEMIANGSMGGPGSEGTQFSGMVQGNAPSVPPVGQGAMPPPEGGA